MISSVLGTDDEDGKDKSWNVPVGDGGWGVGTAVKDKILSEIISSCKGGLIGQLLLFI